MANLHKHMANYLPYIHYIMCLCNVYVYVYVYVIRSLAYAEQSRHGSVAQKILKLNDAFFKTMAENM